MKYYRVKKHADQTNISKGKNGSVNTSLIANELYTQKQISKMGLDNVFIKSNLEFANISKNKVYYFFGARFEIGKGFGV